MFTIFVGISWACCFVAISWSLDKASHLQRLVTRCNTPIFHRDPLNQRRWIMKLSLALALAAFLGFGAVSTAFAQDAMGGITNSNGGYSNTSS
jgi:hypothetical protein